MSRVRSPNYPALSLNEAVGRIRAVYEREFNHPAEKQVIAEALGYSGLNGASTAIISALVKYGLLEPAGEDRFRVSADAVDILLHSKGHPERTAAISKLAFLPALFEELQNQFGRTPPSDNNLRVYLIKRGFNPRTVGEVIRSYRDTLEFVDAESAASSTESWSEEQRQMPTQTQTSSGAGRVDFTSISTSSVPEKPRADLELTFKIAEDCEARTEFRGRVTQEAIKKLIAHLELSLDVFPKKEPIVLEGILGRPSVNQ